MELAISEAESEASGSSSSFSTRSASSDPCRSSCQPDFKLFTKSPGDCERQAEPGIVEHTASKDHWTYEEREIRRKERNNAASRKSRALRKRRFQRMLLETERLTNSNAKLRALIEELNSIMAESRAILFEKFAGTASVDPPVSTRQAMTDLRE